MRVATATTPPTPVRLARTDHLPPLLDLTDAQAREALVLVGKYLIGQPSLPLEKLVEAIDEAKAVVS